MDHEREEQRVDAVLNWSEAGAPSKAPGGADADALLIARARKGSAEAFEALYRRHCGRVYAVCLRMESDAHRAEERTQEVFIQAWRNLDRFRGDSAFPTWLHRIAVNAVLSARRARVRRKSREEAMGTEDGPARLAAGSNAGLRLDLEAAIARLPEGARTVFVLHDVEGYRHHEIAEMLGGAVGTAKAQLHRARKLLREILR